MLKETQPQTPSTLDLDGQEDFDLWVREPDSEKLDRTVAAARLCSCSDVCLAVMEDKG